MNIDVVNSIVAKKLGISVEKVEMVNRYYWTEIRDHIYDYNDRPVTIEGICVIYPNEYHVKKLILSCIAKLRNVKDTTKFKEGSVRTGIYIEENRKALRGYLKIRKANKFTN